MDELEWERNSAVEGGRFPLNDHTTGSENGFFIQLARDNVQKAGDRAFFVSQEMDGSSRPRCMSFWYFCKIFSSKYFKIFSRYFMYEPIVDTTGPNLGKLSIWTRTIDTSDQLVMTPVEYYKIFFHPNLAKYFQVWRLSNGHGPSWHFGQAQVTTDTSFQVEWRHLNGPYTSRY